MDAGGLFSSSGLTAREEGVKEVSGQEGKGVGHSSSGTGRLAWLLHLEMQQ